MQFRTHTGEIVTGQRLQDALDAVSLDYFINAFEIRKEDAYASHIAEKQKDEFLAKDIAFAQSIKTDGVTSTSLWQSVNQKLTGECIALLPF